MKVPAAIILIGVMCLTAAEPKNLKKGTPEPIPPPEAAPADKMLPEEAEPKSRLKCGEPPSDEFIKRRLPKGAKNVRHVGELLLDKMDQPRFYPLVGLAQLHHCHWKYTITYVEVTEIKSGLVETPRVMMLYIDHDHLHVLIPIPEEK